MSTLKELYVAGYIIDSYIERLYKAFIDASVIVAGFNEGKKLRADSGICSLILNGPAFCGSAKCDVNTMLNAVFQTWPKYSGSTGYPVPYPDMDPVKAYSHFKYHQPEAMWDRLHPYGANRRELLTHCINEVSKLRLEIQNGLKPRINR